MPNYKLYYFNGRGRAEAIRLCFAAAGVEYEDVRLKFDDWQKKKKEGFSPLGYLPMLEVDGKKLCESNAIVRYVARETGVCLADNFDIGLCDMIVDACEDCLGKMKKVYDEKDAARKKALREEFNNNQLPAFLTNMTGLLKSNNDGKGFFVGDKLTYADIVFLALWDKFETAGTDVLNFFDVCKKLEPSATEKFPEVKALIQRLRDIKGIKEWLQKRPETPF